MSDAPVSLANALSDRYTIERLLGHGGMATVHLAEDERRGWVAYLRVHPIVDSLRAEPRFDEIVKRMKFGAPAA
jgi:serine/threonine protein kinase